jgi:hypothetical protein
MRQTAIRTANISARVSVSGALRTGP